MIFFLTRRTFIQEIKDKYGLKVNYKFIFCLLLTDVIKEHEDLLREVKKR